MSVYRKAASIFLLAGLAAGGCSGVPARGRVAGQTVETRVDSEAARYFLTNYLAGARTRSALNERIDRVYRHERKDLPDREYLKKLSQDFSVDFAALYFADRVAQVPANRRLREQFQTAYARLERGLGDPVLAPTSVARYEFVFVPGYLYRRHRMTGADLAGPRAALRRAGAAHYFVETVEDASIEANAALVLDTVQARAQNGKRLVLVSVSKSGAEVALALTRLNGAVAKSVAAWINIVGTLQGSPLADDALQQWADLVSRVDPAGVESLTTARSRQRFTQFRLPDHVLVVNYVAVPLSGDISVLARTGYWDLLPHGPNDGLALLPDMVMPGGVTLVEVGRDHFLVDDQRDLATMALAAATISMIEEPARSAADR